MARIIIVALLSPALLAGWASAECAWVLWGEDRQNQFRVMGDAQKSLENCRQVADLLTRADTTKTFVYSCLPDTIDPRGPKGGSR